MKMNKQTIQVLVLSGLMLVLIIGAVMTYGGGNKAPAPAVTSAPSTTTTANKPGDTSQTPDKQIADDTKVIRKKGNPADLLWIDTARLETVVADVKGGADPFENLMTPPPIIAPITNANNTSATTANGDTKPLPAIDATITQQVKLFWLNAGEIKKLLLNEGFRLKIKAINDSSRNITMTGMRIDVEDALKIIREADKEPPKPKFRLVGVLKTSNKNFVILAVNGQQYELYEGDTINKLGWSVAAINDSGVRLTKGRQTILLPIGGQP
ncbi:MAG: hypothetical protein WCO98_01330 [bacterium]